jgi:hypothetical protein
MSEQDDEETRQGPPPVDTPVVQPVVLPALPANPGLSAEMVAVMQIMQQQMHMQAQAQQNAQQLALEQLKADQKAMRAEAAAQARRAERDRKADQEQQQNIIKLLIDQMVVLNNSTHRHDPRSAPRQRSYSQSNSDMKACHRCGKIGHKPNECWFREKNCMNCDRVCHIAPVCRQPKRTSQGVNQTQNQASGSSNHVEALLKAVTATANGVCQRQKAD